MRKTWIVGLMVAAGLYFCGAAMAQDTKGKAPGMNQPGMNQPGMAPGEDQGMKKGRMGLMPPMGCPKMHEMMNRTVVATSDGGVVVVIGDRIIKYDKDLNVVKEAEIKMDAGAMHKKMLEMKKDCPMMNTVGPDKGKMRMKDR